jgi:uncharacterized membrane protein
MVDIQREADNGLRRFVLQPNQSISWRATCYLLLSLLFIIGVIAVGLSLMGFWLILPFAGLELAAVTAGLYTVARRGQQREVISIGDEFIRIERGYRHPEQSLTLATHWAKVILERCPRRWYPSRLLIRSHGQSVEVGRFLNEEERHRLADELVKSLAESAAYLRAHAGQA